ncbi:hypothetical protein [Mesonia aestuariivivens]|uniref:Uncharacterized protein n=1 Tax=Mesonia aestuariivivens TaxID=2796128 RepID=A0ABS6W341_9FLAO|nr:hypothetical protein [Mesonia aestuariivivens]MBW2962277.1 hypothetical protein [Mesonia aestuariivivens]
MEIKGSIHKALEDFKKAREESEVVDKALKANNNQVQVKVDKDGKLLSYSFTITIPEIESEPPKPEDLPIETI